MKDANENQNGVTGVDHTTGYAICQTCKNAPNGRNRTRVHCCAIDIQKPTKEQARLAWNRVSLHNVECDRTSQQD